MKQTRRELQPLGKRFGKLDLDRVGFFHDPSPAPFDKYTGTTVKFREGIEKGRQLHPGPPTPLFEQKFTRIFYGEALNEPWRSQPKDRLKREEAKIAGRLLPPSPAQKHATPGDYYGCFEKISYFSPALKEERKKQRVPELPNVKIKPNPRGGPGYADIGMSPYPTYSHEPYDREIRFRKGKPVGRFLSASAPLDFFPPNPYEDQEPGLYYIPPDEAKTTMLPPGRIYVPFPKKPGGNHSGCFEKFPSYSSDPYIKDKEKKKELGPFLAGAPTSRSKYTNSTINYVTAISCNAQNYHDYQARVYPLDK
ncbi:cilia-and flagella-associated protein 96 [Megalopta genalis]|uniref:cilia-and flagella-associated protein 96 n=1 Tax=Megalopta genalis TaxID=115081 RepID=UPI003FD05D85